MQRTLLAVILTVTLTISGVVFAQGPGHMMMRGNPEMMMEKPPSPPAAMCLMGIELTDKQKDNITKLQVTHEREMAKLRSDNAGIQDKVKLLITDDNFKASDLNSLSKKSADFAEKRMQMRVNHMRAMRAELTPDQRVIFDRNVMKMKHGGGMKGRSHMGGGMRNDCGPGPR